MREWAICVVFTLIAVAIFSGGLYLGAATGTFYGWTP